MKIFLIIFFTISTLSLIPLILWMRYRWFIYRGHRRRDIPITPRRFLLSLYSLIVFTLLVYGIALPYTLSLLIFVWNKNLKLSLYHRFLCTSVRFILWAIPDIDFTFNNRIGEKFNSPAVIISNHQGFLDLMCIMMMTPRLVVLTNGRAWRNPLYGWIIRFAGFYPVANGVDYNIAKLKRLVDKGYSVTIFPEGTRSPDCRIMRFHTGAFYLADKLGIDILPVILHGPGHCLPKTDFMLRPGHMYLEVMERIKITDNNGELYYRAIARETRRLYQHRYDSLCRERETAQYFVKYVLNKYYYIARHDIYLRIKDFLNNPPLYADVVDADYAHGTTIEIIDDYYGAKSWLMALVHRQTHFIAILPDKNALNVAQSTALNVDNLIFKCPR